jgi:hypothetical protein
MESNNDLRVLVVLEADTIVVTMPGTGYSISYRKLHDTLACRLRCPRRS